MGISRGFRRLSVLVGIIGSAFVLIVGFDNNRVPEMSVSAFAGLLFVFVVAPVAFVLLLGWVVAGFRS